MSLPARSSVWSAVELPGHGRVGDLLHADDDVHAVSSWCVSGRADRTGHAAGWPDSCRDRAHRGETSAYRRDLTRKRDLDVLVVGAGPAGWSRPAIEARRLGLDVLVVDKARFPRDKTCGDGLTTGALRLLDALGVDVREPARRTRRVSETVLVSPTGREVVVPAARRRRVRAASCHASSSTPRSSTTRAARASTCASTARS